jgi:tRNA-splicing ligase RtcB
LSKATSICHRRVAGKIEFAVIECLPLPAGAGRMMSRKAANEKFNWKDVNRFLKQQGVTLISAGLDEVPMAYKNIREVMAAQNDLVTVLGEFMSKLVKMAPSGERPED